jgi:ubiquinone/menaquinone biosynthesis C-methylase UbiE
MIRRVIIWAIAIVVAIYLARQARKPNKWLGRPFLWAMNLSHSALTDWGLQQVSIEPDFKILDIGCGGGRTIQKLASVAAEGLVCGVDYSTGSVAVARSKNAQLIKDGCVEIRQGSVSQLPFPDDYLDVAKAVETQYYRPDLVNDMKEDRRVLKPRGRFAVIAETYRGGRFDSLMAPVMKLLSSSSLSVQDQRELFVSAGYDDVKVIEDKNKGWICAIGQKPMPVAGRSVE